MILRRYAVSFCALTASVGLIAEAWTSPEDESRGLLEAARSVRLSEWREPPETAGIPVGGIDRGWIRGVWDDHKWHLLTTLLMVETDYLYAREVGTSSHPLLFDDAPGIDTSVHDATYREGASLNFVESYKTNILQAVALASIFGSHEGPWGETADDFMGLIEADKFNTASTGLVKRIVGRRRPELDRADPSVIGQEEYDAIQAGDSGHLSFYSAAASEAFTYCSYLDLVVARRLEGRRGWRIATGVGLYGLAGYIAYTRLRQGEHYLTDVLAGAAAGTFIGRGFYKVNHGEEDDARPRRESRIHLNPPMPVPGGGMISMTIELGSSGPGTAGR